MGQRYVIGLARSALRMLLFLDHLFFVPTLLHRKLWFRLALMSSLVMSFDAVSATSSPFTTTNYTPLTHIFGIPPMYDVDSFRRNRAEVSLRTDISSQFAVSETGQELAAMDGDMYRTTFSYAAKPSNNFHWQIAIPYVEYRGGSIDGFVNDWHKVFGLPQGGRNKQPKDRQLYYYQRNGKVLLELREPQAGMGDILLTGQWKIKLPFGRRGGVQALTASLKLPTGDDKALLGSGAVDVSAGFAANTPDTIKSYDINWFTSYGAMWLGKSYYLSEQQRPIVLFAGFGASFSFSSSIHLKAQFDAHSAFYSNTNIAEIGQEALQFTFGGEWRMSKRWRLDMGLSEDFIVNASPDVTLHLGLYAGF